MVKIKKSYFRRRKRLEERENNPPKRAYNKMQALGPIIFGLFFAPAMVVTSLISQAAFLMVANIVFSVGSLFTITFGIYEKLRDQKYQAAFLEFLLTAGIMTGLFFLAFTYAPLIPGTGLIATICFINLFASSINIFMLLRHIILPPLFSIYEYCLRKLGFNSNIALEDAPDFSLQDDDCAHDLVNNNYESKNVDQEKENWKEKALIPFNKTVNMLFKYYIKKYLLSFLGAIERAGDIKDRQANYNALVEKASIESTHKVFFKKKLSTKARKVSRLTAAYTECENVKNADFATTRKSTLLRFFEKGSVNSKVDHAEYTTALADEIRRQSDKIVALLECFPLHLALEYLQKVMGDSLSDAQIKYFRARIINEDNRSIYTEDYQQQLGLNDAYDDADLFSLKTFR